MELWCKDLTTPRWTWRWTTSRRCRRRRRNRRERRVSRCSSRRRAARSARSAVRAVRAATPSTGRRRPCSRRRPKRCRCRRWPKSTPPPLLLHRPRHRRRRRPTPTTSSRLAAHRRRPAWPGLDCFFFFFRSISTKFDCGHLEAFGANSIRFTANKNFVNSKMVFQNMSSVLESIE